jgi:cell division protein FtsB
VLVGLYEEPEKPHNALEFILKHLATGASGSADVAILKEENEALKREVEALKATVADLQKKIDQPAE